MQTDSPVIRGANATAFNSRLPELILSGPARCGKTFAILFKLQELCLQYPDLRIAIVRKTRVSMNVSVLETWEDEVYPNKYLIHNPIDRRSRAYYKYPNGSQVHLIGMDNPEKLLSSQWDIIYVNEVSELTEEEFGIIGSRLQRSKGPFNQLIADCNPPKKGKEHWIWKRHERKETVLLFSELNLNPALSEDGRKRLESLRRDLKRRFYDGSWDALPEDGLFKPHWFKYLKERPAECEWKRGWDIASGESETADESAGVRMGLPYKDKRNRIFDGRIVIDDCTAGRWGPRERNAQMLECAKADAHLECTGYFEKGFGIGTDMTLSVINSLTGYSMYAIKPKGSKLFNADPWAAQCEAGNIYLVEGDWNAAFVRECCEFNGEEGGKDNKVDAASLAFKMLMRDFGDRFRKS